MTTLQAVIPANAGIQRRSQAPADRF